MSTFARKATGLEFGADAAGEVHDLMSRDVVEPRSQLANDGETLANNLGLLVQRVSLSCAQEIDGLIRDLKMLRERLHYDGAWRARSSTTRA